MNRLAYSKIPKANVKMGWYMVYFWGPCTLCGLNEEVSWYNYPNVEYDRDRARCGINGCNGETRCTRKEKRYYDGSSPST